MAQERAVRSAQPCELLIAQHSAADDIQKNLLESQFFVRGDGFGRTIGIKGRYDLRLMGSCLCRGRSGQEHPYGQSTPSCRNV